MDYVAADGMQISRMTLGTVQLGLDYGVANIGGKPDRAESMKILEAAGRSGVNCFDTAPGYGDSEEVVGSFVSHYAGFSVPPVVISKLPQIDLEGRLSTTAVTNRVREHLVRSMERLRVRKIAVCLLHRPSDMNAQGGLIVESLARLRDEGIVGVIGASVYSPAEVEQALSIPAFEAVQVPVNVFDHRLIETGLLDDLKGRNMAVFARSVFLQGLFFLDPGNLPARLRMAEKPLRRLHQMCNEQGVGVAQLALAFVRDLAGVTSLVIGAEKPAQVLHNVNLMQSPSLVPALTNQIIAAFSDLPLELIDPRMWESNRCERVDQST